MPLVVPVIASKLNKGYLPLICRFALYHRLIIANYRLLFFEKTIIFYLPLLFVFCFICPFLSPEFSYIGHRRKKAATIVAAFSSHKSYFNCIQCQSLVLLIQIPKYITNSGFLLVPPIV